MENEEQNMIKDVYTNPILGSKVHYIHHGSGRAIVFISGWCGTADNFIPLIKNLPNNFECFALDLPGFGQSTSMSLPHTVQNYAVFMEEFIKINNLNNPILVGISFGASVFLYHAINHGNDEEKIILQSPSYRPFNVTHTTKCQTWLLIHFPILTLVILRLLKYSFFKKVFAFFGDHNVKSITFSDLATYGLRNLHFTSPRSLIESLVDILRFDVQDKITTAKGRFLLVIGSDENLFSQNYQSHLCSSLPNCKVSVLQGATHYAMIQKAEEFDQLIIDFITA